MGAKVDRRLLTVPAGWRETAKAFLGILDAAMSAGAWKLRALSLPQDWRRKPLFRVDTVKPAPGSQGQRRLIFQPHSLRVEIPAKDGQRMQEALTADTSVRCERCGARGAVPRLLHGWENRCDTHATKGKRKVQDEVPVTEV